MTNNLERRQLGRRSTWSAHHKLFNPRLYSVEEVTEAVAKAFVISHHYSGTYPAARFRVGLFDQTKLVGVAVYSVPASQKVIPRYADIKPSEGVELGRLVLHDECGYNAETWFVSRSFKLLKRKLAPRFCLSYSDPFERMDSDGKVIKRGHVGQIYQALNASYFGRASKCTLLLLPSGRVMSPRALGKIRRGERGHVYATEQLVKGGAPQREDGESGEDYVARVSSYFTKIRHPGNLAYGWRFDRHVKFKLPELPYPKTIQEIER